MPTSQSQPAFVLVRPQMGENIGAAARAMWNFRLDRMRITAPRDGWPNQKAVAMASGAGRLLDEAQIFDTTADAIGDCDYVYATTARPRELTKPVFTPEAAMSDARDRIAAGGKVSAFEADQSLPDCELIVDTLLGTGLQREVTGLFRQVIEQINVHPADVIAMDIPSGLQADTGQICGIAVMADLTVTFIAMKQGLLTGQARQYTVKLQLAELGIPDEVFTRVPTDQRIISQADIKSALKPRLRHAHKGHHGHSLLIGGTAGMSGAIQLAGTAALRCGSGLVSIATHPAHAAGLNLNRPELMVHTIAAAEPAQQLRSLLDKKTALGIGPGLGKNAWAQQLLLLALDAELPMVIDADALNLLAGMNRRQDNWILTPHPAEAARLLAWAGKIKR